MSRYLLKALFGLRHLHKKGILAGLFLIISTLTALIVANSDFKNSYESFLYMPVVLSIGSLSIKESVVHFVNDTLMVVFFFMVGIELKYEFFFGNLRSIRQATLPMISAAGGMVVPAAIYVWCNIGTGALQGWAIPAATDIAFAVGFISLLGDKIPKSLRIYLLALAVFDDVGAIGIIALFYTTSINATMLFYASIVIVSFMLLVKFDIRTLLPYVLLTLLLWLCVLHSGIHATLAGVVAALFFPTSSPAAVSQKNGAQLIAIEKKLYKYVYYCILPLFAFINTGVDLSNVSLNLLAEPVALGVTLGLVLGKPLGIVSFAYLGIRLGLCSYPKFTTLKHIIGASFLCGIGFTMSLFIEDLAFDPDLVSQAALGLQAKVGILLGSTVSAILGLTWLKKCCVVDANTKPLNKTPTHVA